MSKGTKSANKVATKSISFSTFARWVAYALFALVPLVLYLVNADLERTRPQREAVAAEKWRAEAVAHEKAHPTCVEVRKSEVLDKDGKVLRTDAQEYKVLCDKLPPEPRFWDTLSLAEKVVYCIVGFIITAVALIWGGGGAFFVIAAILGG